MPTRTPSTSLEKERVPQDSLLLGVYADDAEQPAYFRDLFLDQIVTAAARNREDHDLDPLYRQAADSIEEVVARQEVVRDLERGDVRTAADVFAAALRDMRAALAWRDAHRHPLQKQYRALQAARLYTAAVRDFASALKTLGPASKRLKSVGSILSELADAQGFREVEERAAATWKGLGSVRYDILIDGLDVTIAPARACPDFGQEVVEAYRRFDQGEREQFEFPAYEQADLGIIEEKVVEQVARAFPAEFEALAGLAKDLERPYRDEAVARLDRELQFIVGYLDLVTPLRDSGLPFCMPEVTAGKDVNASDAFDLALALNLAGGDRQVVENGFSLAAGERIIVVSGPNQGGKTTFARMFGQLHHLACLGLPVPGTAARLHLFDTILTHFERKEVSGSPHGKLQDELVRMHDILADASGDSIVIMNELFSSTTFRDARALSEKIYARLAELDLLCVWISFIDELSTIGPTMVSMVSTVDPDDPARRTFRVERRRADGLAYARAIAAKYGLDRDALKRRLAR